MSSPSTKGLSSKHFTREYLGSESGAVGKTTVRNSSHYWWTFRVRINVPNLTVDIPNSPHL
jgi:hypothetical protein